MGGRSLPWAKELAQAERTPGSLVQPLTDPGVTQGQRATPSVTSTLTKRQVPGKGDMCLTPVRLPLTRTRTLDSELTHGCAHTPREQGPGRKGRKPETQACVALATSLHGRLPPKLTPRGSGRDMSLLRGRQGQGPRSRGGNEALWAPLVLLPSVLGLGEGGCTSRQNSSQVAERETSSGQGVWSGDRGMVSHGLATCCTFRLQTLPLTHLHGISIP